MPGKLDLSAFEFYDERTSIVFEDEDMVSPDRLQIIVTIA